MKNQETIQELHQNLGFPESGDRPAKFRQGSKQLQMTRFWYQNNLYSLTKLMTNLTSTNYSQKSSDIEFRWPSIKLRPKIRSG